MDVHAKKLRVLVVDDSAVMRKLIADLLVRDPEIEVVATAMDGDFAITRIEQLRPDVVTLDVDMPRMDGITALGLIMAKHKLPVLMVSSLTARDAALTLRALQMGAVDFVCKPKDLRGIGAMAEELISKIKAAARNPMVPPALISPGALSRSKRIVAGVRPRRAVDRVVAIGASSGGPNALTHVLPRIPADFAAGIVLVQHMPESFTSVLANWLDEMCELEVREARQSDPIVPGVVLVAPGSRHMRVKRMAGGGVIDLEKGSPVNGHMPSADVLFHSVAEEYGDRAAAIILTGMGTDGAEGIGEIYRAGGRTLAQNRDTSSVFGMPRVAIERGYAQTVSPLSDIASWMIAAVGRQRGVEGSTNGKSRQ
jgi:two-component system chemotaxis response regulator CheB